MMPKCVQFSHLKSLKRAPKFFDLFWQIHKNVIILIMEKQQAGKIKGKGELMKQLNCLMFGGVLLVSMVLGCHNPVSSPSEPFVIKSVNQSADSTGYCHQRILPYSNKVFCAETLHYSDTAGAPVSFQNDTDDTILISPGGPFYQSINIDSTDCNGGGCKYWVEGIQVDTVVSWNGMYICSFMGQLVSVVKPIKTSKFDIGYPNDTVKITYRDSINTTAGSTRNNLLLISRNIDMQHIEISAPAPPTGISVSGAYVRLPVFIEAYFSIAISSGVAPGIYSFEFSVNIDNKFYGNIPCTIKVL